jgi:hypothetical protein
MEHQQFYVGLSFAAAFVAFLMIAFMKGGNLTSGQRLILRLLGSLCAALAGAVISGTAFFSLVQNTPGGKITVQGVAGFAIFMIIWFTFPKDPVRPDPVDGICLSIPAGMTFQNAVDALAEQESAVTEYAGFEDDELAAILKPWRLSEKTTTACILLLGSITQKRSAVRPYQVKQQGSKYRLSVKK